MCRNRSICVTSSISFQVMRCDHRNSASMVSNFCNFQIYDVKFDVHVEFGWVLNRQVNHCVLYCQLHAKIWQIMICKQCGGPWTKFIFPKLKFHNLKS